MTRADTASAAASPAAGREPVPIDAIPRVYNFAADILERNLAAGRADKAAYIDHARYLELRRPR